MSADWKKPYLKVITTKLAANEPSGQEKDPAGQILSFCIIMAGIKNHFFIIYPIKKG